MHHFFLPPDQFRTDTISFPPDTARQMALVLRLQPGERVIALDGLGMEYEVELLQVGRAGVQGRVMDRRPARGEPAARITLYLALTQREKFEWMLQKCTEIGAAAFVPVITSRSLVQERGDAAKKLERWGRIVREAAEQSQRGIVPEVRAPVKFEAALREGLAYHLRLIPWEGEQPPVCARQWRGCKISAVQPWLFLSGQKGAFHQRRLKRRVWLNFNRSPWAGAFCAWRRRPW
jgi:16S rRNA (uracil1498-N3)-methyltransferase